jgi:hypothetical protein
MIGLYNLAAIARTEIIKHEELHDHIATLLFIACNKRAK